MKINYVRCTTTKMDPDCSIGKAIHGGRSIGAAEPRLEDKAGKLSAYVIETGRSFRMMETTMRMGWSLDEATYRELSLMYGIERLE